MRPPHRILHRHHVHRLAAEHLQGHLQLQDYKRRTSARVPWSLLPAAAARITSPSDACGRLDRAPPTRPHARRSWPPRPTPPSCSAGPMPHRPGTCPRRRAGAPGGRPST
ncbi:MAG: hypothetical protein JOZ53_25720 [Planctomycetaceae bacterium]|nr:hypothetical protein [Planctomycetaceae bacterium]